MYIYSTFCLIYRNTLSFPPEKKYLTQKYVSMIDNLIVCFSNMDLKKLPRNLSLDKNKIHKILFSSVIADGDDGMKYFVVLLISTLTYIASLITLPFFSSFSFFFPYDLTFLLSSAKFYKFQQLLTEGQTVAFNPTKTLIIL